MPNLDVSLLLVGGPTLLMELAGVQILTDPTFDPPGKYDSRGIVLEKTAGPSVSAEALGAIDAVLLSHDQHFDNLDHAGRAFLPKAKAVFTTRSGAERLGQTAKGLAPWEEAFVESPAGQRLFVTATPARHGPPGIEPATGDVVGFLLGVDRPGDAVYVTGDTVWYEGVAEVARRFSPRLIVLFAGSAKPRGPFHVTMDNNDAIEAAHAFPGARLVAIHNHGWAHFTESQADTVQAFATLGLAARLIILELGKRVSLRI